MGSPRGKPSRSTRTLRLFAIALRSSIAVVFAVVAIVAAVAWAANWVVPLAVLQTVGLADKSNLGGVYWQAHLQYEPAPSSLWIGVRGTNVRVSWFRMAQEVADHASESTYGNPWPFEFRTGRFSKPITRRSADGTTVEYPGFSKVSLELPLLGLLILGIYPAVLLWRGPIRLHSRRKRGQCLACGYDLRGTEGGTCPECGKPFVNDNEGIAGE